MDWKNKRFDREAVFHAQRDLVLEAARSFAAESLVGWQITDTADGFEARGDSASHAATAKFRVEPAPSGTKVAVMLLVERAGPLGFMLFDVGGYYDGQLRKWLEGIQWHLHQRLASATPQESFEPGKQAIPKATGARPLYVGCLVALFVLPLFLFCISAVVGLLTGHLYLVDRRGGTIHGPWARIISGIILMIAVLIVLRVLKTRRKARDQQPG
ncbi:MAG TPA: hypothetical protein VJZ91_18485 [Blastocatellia bacterium]|nr:hypothetical protein [Blastocatellia bacterium]